MDRRKSLISNDLGRRRPAPLVVSPYTVRVYGVKFAPFIILSNAQSGCKLV
jgi:hypothetical protein